MIDRLSGRVALLVVVVATLLVVLLGWFVLLAPERAKATTLDAQIDDTNTQLQAVTNLLEGPIGHQSLVSLRVFQRAIPDDAKVSQILRQLMSTASASGVELDGITPGALVAGAGTETLPISLTVKGQYFGLQKFLRLIRSAADLRGDKVRATGRLYSVDSIQFSGAGSAQTSSGSTQSGRGNLVAATLALNAFVYNPNAVAAVPVAPAPTSDAGTTTP